MEAFKPFEGPDDEYNIIGIGEDGDGGAFGRRAGGRCPAGAQPSA